MFDIKKKQSNELLDRYEKLLFSLMKKYSGLILMLNHCVVVGNFAMNDNMLEE